MLEHVAEICRGHPVGADDLRGLVGPRHQGVDDLVEIDIDIDIVKVTVVVMKIIIIMVIVITMLVIIKIET